MDEPPDHRTQIQSAPFGVQRPHTRSPGVERRARCAPFGVCDGLLRSFDSKLQLTHVRPMRRLKRAVRCPLLFESARKLVPVAFSVTEFGNDLRPHSGVDHVYLGRVYLGDLG